MYQISVINIITVLLYFYIQYNIIGTLNFNNGIYSCILFIFPFSCFVESLSNPLWPLWVLKPLAYMMMLAIYSKKLKEN